LKKRTRPLFAWTGVLIAAGGVFLFSKTVMVLSVRNLDHPGSFHFKVAPSEQVTLYYTNSIYDAPVEEVYEVGDENLVLKAVKTDSPAVMEYYGFERTGPVQTLNKSLGPSFSIQASMRQDQGLKIGQSTLDLHAIARGGEIIAISLDQVSLAGFIGWKIFGQKKIHPSTKH
jgi:hypothetical protein